MVWASNTALKPAGVPDLVAAACPTSAVTADEFVNRVACVRPGERVLVLGGAGGVGSAAVQFAKLAGASFVAATTTQAALLTRLGADAVVDYRTEGWCVHARPAGLRGVHHGVDTPPGPAPANLQWRHACSPRLRCGAPTTIDACTRSSCAPLCCANPSLQVGQARLLGEAV